MYTRALVLSHTERALLEFYIVLDGSAAKNNRIFRSRKRARRIFCAGGTFGREVRFSIILYIFRPS